MLDFLFSEALMAKIGVALVAALVAITFGKILLSMMGRFLRFWVKLPILAKVILPAVLTTNATAMTLAHELGHAFGCSDIYPKGRLPPKPSLPDSIPKEEFAPFDWNNGTGSRYYEFSITQETLIKRVLMYGVRHEDKRDISLGPIYGFTKYDNDAGLVDVGFFRGNSRKQIMIHR